MAFASQRCVSKESLLNTCSSLWIQITFSSAMAVMHGIRLRLLNNILTDFNFGVSPGRFFAASELKTMLAYILMNYDVKLANDGGRPETLWLGRTALPNPTAEVLFRKRRT